MISLWRQRFLASTRGRLIALLRRESRTVDELAAQLDLTDNAVRAHLTALERDGLVEQRGVRRSGGIGKPAYTYGLTSDADQLFPQPYSAVLNLVFAALDQRMPPDEKDALLRDAGQRLAGDAPRAGDDPLEQRLEAAATALNQLGGLAGVEQRDGAPMICGYNCPLSSVVPEHPEVCHLAEAFVSTVAGLPLREHCDREQTPPHCRFELAEQR